MEHALLERGLLEPERSAFLQALPQEYPCSRHRILGFSREGRPIHLLQIGEGPYGKLLLSGLQGRDWPAGALLLYFCQELLQAVQTGVPLGEVSVERVLERRSLWVVPSLNPDGEARVLGGLGPWPGNANQVDLERNFPGQWTWNGAKGSRRGPRPLSEPESQALFRLCQRPFRQCFVFSWGEGRIRQGTGGIPLPQGDLIGQMLAHSGPYGLTKEREGQSLASWFCRTFHRPAFTLSLGSAGVAPEEQGLGDLYEQLLELFLMLLLV